MTENQERNKNKKSPTERAYDQVVLPDEDEKPKPEWTVNERRAYILELIVGEYGLPSDVPRVDTAKDFDVHHSQIYQDIEILKTWMANNLDNDFEAEAFGLFKSTIKDLKDEDPYKAVKAFGEWSSFLEDRGEVENESEDKVKFTSSDDVDISFTVVSDDDTDESGELD